MGGLSSTAKAPTPSNYGSLADDIEMQCATPSTPASRSPTPGSSKTPEEKAAAKKAKKDEADIKKLRAKMDKLCAKDPSLTSLADELHNLTATPSQLRKIHNLFLEPLKDVNKELKWCLKLDKMLSLSIMILGTVVPMMHMFHVPANVSVCISVMIPILQGISMNLAPHEKAAQLETIKSACISEGHHFLSLTGEYHEADHHDEEEIKHFLEAIEAHRHAKPKGKKKDKDKKKKKDKK